MIDEKKLIQEIKDYFKGKIDKHGKSEITVDVLDLNVDICNIVKNQPKADWIPCEERLPSEHDEYLVW